MMMMNRDLESLVDSIGLKGVVALLADICHRKAEATQATQEYIEGKATDWRADSQTLRSAIVRLSNL